MSDAGDYMAHSWRMTDHVCGRCYARILARPSDCEPEIFRCSNCGAQRLGANESVICACGLPGVQCRLNNDVTPEFPGEIVAVAVGVD